MINKSFTRTVVRPMEIDDLKKVLEIEEQSFPIPWTYNMFCYELILNRYAKYFVLEKDRKIIGYLGFWHKRDRYHITNIAITEKLRKKGYGENLLRYIEKIAVTYKVKKISLEVRRSNYIARNMYRKYRYKVIRFVRNYYQEEKEDAVVMEKKLN